MVRAVSGPCRVGDELCRIRVERPQGRIVHDAPAHTSEVWVAWTSRSNIGGALPSGSLSDDALPGTDLPHRYHIARRLSRGEILYEGWGTLSHQASLIRSKSVSAIRGKGRRSHPSARTSIEVRGVGGIPPTPQFWSSPLALNLRARTLPPARRGPRGGRHELPPGACRPHRVRAAGSPAFCPGVV